MVVIVEEWLDVPQLAKETKIPATTIHRYLSSFKQFFTFKGGKRSRRYESSAITVLLRIKDLYSKGFGSEEVEKKLSKEFPVLLNNEQVETELDKAGLPALVTTEEISELKEALRKQNEAIKLLLQKDAEKTELLNMLIQDRKEQNQLMLKIYEASTDKALPVPEQSEVNKQFIENQQEINKQLLQEFAESKQRDQLLLEKLAEKEEHQEEAAKSAEVEKKGFWKNFFK